MSEIGAGRAGIRRFQALSAFATLATLFLLSPPFIGLFAGEGRVLGLPPIALYVFAVWAAAIVVAFALARRVRRLRPGGDEA